MPSLKKVFEAKVNGVLKGRSEAERTKDDESKLTSEVALSVDPGSIFDQLHGEANEEEALNAIEVAPSVDLTSIVDQLHGKAKAEKPENKA